LGLVKESRDVGYEVAPKTKSLARENQESYFEGSNANPPNKSIAVTIQKFIIILFMV